MAHVSVNLEYRLCFMSSQKEMFLNKGTSFYSDVRISSILEESFSVCVYDGPHSCKLIVRLEL